MVKPSAGIEIAVVPYHECVDDVIAFRNSNRTIARDRKYFDWRYAQVPCAQSALVAWAMQDGKRLAAASIIGHDFHVLDGEYPVGVVGDISVDPQCRGRGVGIRLLQALVGHSALRALRALFVLPNAEAASTLSRAGWQDATAIARFVRIIDTGPRLRRSLGATAPVVALAGGLNVLLGLLPLLNTVCASSNLDTGELEDFEHGFDELWAGLPKDGRVLRCRTRRYLDWRYRDHPTDRYRIFVGRRAGRLVAYLVFRLEGDVATIVDFCGSEMRDGAGLVRAFSGHVGRCLAAEIHVGCNVDSFMKWPWNRMGFIRRRDAQAVMVADAPAKAPLPLAGRAWFVTPGDKDV